MKVQECDNHKGGSMNKVDWRVAGNTTNFKY